MRFFRKTSRRDGATLWESAQAVLLVRREKEKWVAEGGGKKQKETPCESKRRHHAGNVSRERASAKKRKKGNMAMRKKARTSGRGRREGRGNVGFAHSARGKRTRPALAKGWPKRGVESAGCTSPLRCVGEEDPQRKTSHGGHKENTLSTA